eukprot:5318151-Amphidinium_carterae.2
MAFEDPVSNCKPCSFFSECCELDMHHSLLQCYAAGTHVMKVDLSEQDSLQEHLKEENIKESSSGKRVERVESQAAKIEKAHVRSLSCISFVQVVRSPRGCLRTLFGGKAVEVEIVSQNKAS